MLLYSADAMQAGECSAFLDCHELQEALHQDLVHNVFLDMWDEDATVPSDDDVITKTDRRTKNRLSAQQARSGDKQYVQLLLTELESLTETFEMYTAYITQLKVHAVDAVDSMQRLEEMHEQNKIKIAMLQHSDKSHAAPTLMGMPTKDRNRIHARTSRQRKHQFVQDLIKQRDESWCTMQDVMQYTTALEGACSFDDTGYILLQLTETRQSLLMRTGAHKQKFDDLRSRVSFRLKQREKF
jgi:hypothetical protein